MRVAILTDSNSGMSLEDARENGIELMSMPIFINGKSYMENVGHHPGAVLRISAPGCQCFYIAAECR